jgi:ABC-type antimicrobial peptide transport system permease subunit
MAAKVLPGASTAPAPAVGWPRLLAFPFPIRNAVRRWRRLVGMVIGVGIALSFVLILMGLLGGSMGNLIGDFPQSGANLYVVVNGGQLIPLQHGTNPGTIDDGTAVLSKVRSVLGVQAAVGELSWPLKQEREGPRARYEAAQFVPAIAVDGDPNDISNMLVMQQGRWLRRANEVVLGPRLSADKSLPVGASLRLNGQDFEIVGIGQLRGFGPAGDSVAYLDARALRQRAGIGDVLNFIAIQTTSPDLVRRAIDDPSLRVVSAEELAQETYDSRDYRSAIGIYWTMDLFVLLVAGLFVSNMLASSVAERRLEFGTMRAIGLPSRTILFSVAAEALLTSLAAFLVGLGIATALGAAMNLWLAPIFAGLRWSLDLPTFAAILGLTLGLALVAGFLPARAATRVDPLEVLREA